MSDKCTPETPHAIYTGPKMSGILDVLEPQTPLGVLQVEGVRRVQVGLAGPTITLVKLRRTILPFGSKNHYATDDSYEIPVPEEAAVWLASKLGKEITLFGMGV